MKQYLFLFLCIFCLITMSVVAQNTLLLLHGGELRKEGTAMLPVRSITPVSNGILVSYKFDSAILQSDSLHPGTYFWRIAGFGQNDIAGEPSVPGRWDLFTLPNGCTDASITVVENTSIDIPLQLAPSFSPLPEEDIDSLTIAVAPPITPYEGWFPQEVVRKHSEQTYRGKLLIRVGINPVRYDYKNEIVRACTKLVYKVSFSEIKRAISTSPNPRISNDDHFLDNTTLNGNRLQPLTRNVQDTLSTTKDYLIISVPQYEEAVVRFADWKRTLGFRVHIKIKEWWTPESIKAEVNDVYQRNESLYYLLIIGDQKDVPAQRSTLMGYSNDEYVTDLYYGCMDGPSDYLPDLYRGRLPVSTSEEAMTVVNKIIRYEKSPIHDTDFYRTGLHCAYFQDQESPTEDFGPGDGFADRRFAQTSEEIRDYMLSKDKTVHRVYYTLSHVHPMYWNNGRFSFGEPIPKELLKPSFAWNGNSTNIIKHINEGVFYVLHRGHGEETYWDEPRFTTFNIQELANGDKLPVVFSFNCKTGNFQKEVCFSKTFLVKKGGGCVAVYGATTTSYTGYNDALAEGMFDAVWPSPGLDFKIPKFEPYFPLTPTPIPTYCLGQILDQGMIRMEETWGIHEPRYMKYTREIFHCFGDPSMKIPTDVPIAFKEAIVTRDSCGIHVDLGKEPGNIAFYNEQTGKVSSLYGTKHDYTGDESHVRVCVSGQNRIPLIDLPYNVLYIQNCTIQGPKNYESDVIKVGANVTEEKTSGKVVFDGGKITLTGKRVIFDRGTAILPNTKLHIQPSK